MSERSVPGRRLSERWTARSLSLAAFCCLACAWQVFAAGSAWQPQAVAASLMHRPGLLGSAASVTVVSALAGLVVGSAVGVGASWLCHLVPGFEAPVRQWLLVSYAVPLVGAGPLLATVVDRGAVPAVTATVSALFPAFSTSMAGLAAEPKSLGALVAVHGARLRHRLRWVTVPHSLPYLLEAVKLAVPAALLGAVVGEWFGAEEGLGVLLASGLREGQEDLVVAVTVVVLALSMAGYGLLAHCSRAVGRRRGITGLAP